MRRRWLPLGILTVVALLAIYTHTARRSAPPIAIASQPGRTSTAAAPPPAQSRPSQSAHFDTSILKPPAGARVAIYEFEDLECPGCAHAFPIVRAAVDRYHIPLVRHDYPLTFHLWSLDAAITARYLEDRVSPALAEDFRGAVFANQTRIASKDDLAAFTRGWFQAHNQSLPFVMDPSGACKLEVESDRALGDRVGVGVHGTPCIFVVTQTAVVRLDDVSELYRTIDQALAQTASSLTMPEISEPRTRILGVVTKHASA